jgi:maleamate amidohydrolase
MRDNRDLSADYAAAGFGGALSPGRRPALLLVDFARAYFDPASPLFADVAPVRASAARLRAAAHNAGVPAIFTRVEYVAGDPSRNGGVFYRKLPALTCFDRGNPLGDFTSELEPTAGDHVVTKCFPSAFFDTGLAEHLHDLGIDTCVITGLSTSGCVRATALDALCHGFIPLVVEDACGDRDRRVHDANIFDLRAKYAEIVTTDAMIGYFESMTSSGGRAAEKA